MNVHGKKNSPSHLQKNKEPVMYLTTKKIDNAKPKKKIFYMFDGNGLYLQVSPQGGKYWRFKYRFDNKEQRIAFGVYPDVSLQEAREKREKARKQVAAGINPIADKKDQRRMAAISAENTFETIAREWHELNKDNWHAIYRGHIIHRLEMDIFPQIGKMPITSIKPLHILDALRLIEKRGAEEVARRTLQYCSQVFRYAIITERAERNPALDLRGALRPMKHGHYAAIEINEMPDFLQALSRNDARLFPQTRDAVQLLMLTFVRTGELIGAKWKEFDLEKAEWNIPAERMKMRRPHFVPLSRQVLDILKEQYKVTGQWDWVFPNQSHPKKHMSNNTVLGAIARLGYKGRMTGHGFRALAMSTIKEKLGYRHEVIDRQLAHAPRNKVDAAYDRAQFLDERRVMMQKWADYLDTVAANGKVIHVDFEQAAE
ncbi:MAG: integrase arm-type DNA-binding domain-containing protein [Alphaproteobacteria bacterium]